MKYNEIITEDDQDLLINSEKRLKTMLSYGEVTLPAFTAVIINIENQYDIYFPKNFKINGSLRLKRGRPRIISGDLIVTGLFKCINKNADLSELTLKTNEINLHNVIKLPKELIINGSLELDGTKAKNLPDKLHIGGGLHIIGSNITELPNDFKIGRDLEISLTAISKLPDNLIVGGNLNIAYTAITELPNDLKVGGKIFISNDQTIKIPKHLKAKVVIFNSKEY